MKLKRCLKGRRWQPSMFIRIKKRWSNRPHKHLAANIAEPHKPCYVYSAQLIESKRVEGKPRQKVLAVLATIRETELSNSYAQFCFWQQCIEVLEAQNALDQKHINKIKELVLLPVPDEIVKGMYSFYWGKHSQRLKLEGKQLLEKMKSINTSQSVVPKVGRFTILGTTKQFEDKAA